MSTRTRHSSTATQGQQRTTNCTSTCTVTPAGRRRNEKVFLLLLQADRCFVDNLIWGYCFGITYIVLFCMFDFNNNSTGRITSSQRHTMPQSMDKFQRFEAWLKENGARFDVVSDQLLRVAFVLYIITLWRIHNNYNCNCDRIWDPPIGP